MTATYRLHGLSVCSPYPLGHRVEDRCVDITFTVHRAPEDLHTGELSGRRIAELSADRPYYELVERGSEGYVYRFHGLADIAIPNDQRDVGCWLVPGANESMMPVVLAGNVISALLLLRGECVLHASGVEHGGATVALVGSSGSGKSTLAALASLHGARLVTDDVLRVVFDDRSARCFRGAASLRLRATSKALAEIGNAAVETTADDRHLLPATPIAQDQIELNAIVFPRLRKADHPLVRSPVDAKDALFALMACPRVYNWDDISTSAAHFSALATLVERVPCYTLDVPWGVDIDASWTSELVDTIFSGIS